MNEKLKILIVEDEVITAMALGKQLDSMGYEILPWAVSYNNAVEILRSEKPDILLCDIRLGEARDGIDLVRDMDGEFIPKVIFMTGYDNPDIKERAERTKPLAYLIKPVNALTVVEIIKSAFS